MTIPNDELAELSKPFSPNLAHTATDLMQGPNNTGGMDNEHDIDSKIGTLYSPIVQGISDPKMSMSFAQDWDINNWVTNIQPEEPFHHDDPTAVGGPFNAYSHLMYRNSGEGYPMGNHSCNTFVTTSSSDGDPCLMTPPPKTSPMPIVPQESLPRRGSNSSELVNDLNTICIQPSWSHPGWYEGSYYHPPMLDIGPAMDHSPKMPQPQIAVTNSPTLVDLNKTTSKISAVPLVDLAARRNRPRPATLRPDAHRSQSYAGPLTMSPTSKVPSLGIASSPSVRRIKSTGQNLNVASNGRIQKSGPASAQLSPRNLQSFMDAAGLSQSRFPKRQNTDTSQSPAPNCTPLTPLSSGKLDFVKPEPQPSRSPFVGPAAPGWNQTYGHSAPNAFDDVAHDIKSPPITPFNVEAFPQMISHDRKHDSFYPCPPQSAPPQQTSFFGDSPTLPAANASHQSWQVPSSSLLLETYPDDRMSIPRPIQMPQLGYPEQHSQYMTPLHQYLRGPSSMMNGLPNYFANSTPPPKDLEIQVHLIPKPQGAPQARKKYTFNNTTPKDFLQTVY